MTVIREIERPAATIGRHPRVPRKAGTLGYRVTARRLELGLTQQEVADLAAISVWCVRHLECNAYGTMPTAYTLAALAVALRTTMDALWFGDPA